ncbi:MAG: metallophosphoesterase [Solirubrobacterales bacterium]|nr:metallophosphoesterase [Solirubrobacterales bacterium]
MKSPWPPIPKHGASFIHFGEDHWNDPDGLRIFPKVVRQSGRYQPDLVTSSADKDANGTVANLKRWRSLMRPYDRRKIPYFAAVGNHDREARPGFPDGVDPMGDLSNYMSVFARRPYPFGDARPYRVPGLMPRRRPASDPPGASSHYAVEFGPVRWVFIDNSCFGITNCDPLQNPPFPDAEGNQGQYDFLASEAAKARMEGDQLFVVMHMPTQDDRPEHTEPTPGPHTMGEGSSPDNALFEQAAAAAGADAVFTGHIKGMWKYRASGIPYFTDGGAGGEVYVGPAEETGVDYGYWHGYRLIRAWGNRLKTDAIPVFRRGGISIRGRRKVPVGEVVRFSATGQQPTAEGADVKLELRAPDPTRPNASKLPTPAHIWSTGDKQVLRPIGAKREDPRRNPMRQTVSGRFRALCPGRTVVRVKSGWEAARYLVRVRGKPRRSCRRGSR